MTDLPLAALTPFDVARFLLGQRDAIVDVAQAPGALGVGALFVLSAGLAREYDGEDLYAEPQHLVIPFLASLATSLLLFTGVYITLRAHGGLVTGYWSLYAHFLAVYWMTAPLAWLYALPVERWLSAKGAVKANLWLLALVSAWRVALTIRIVMVLFGAAFMDAGSLVGAFAATVAAVTAWTLPMPIISMMGGIRLSEKDNLIRGVMFWIRGLSLLASPALWLLAWQCLAHPIQRWHESTVGPSAGGIHLSLWVVAGASILVWLWLARGPQREQRLRRLVERSLQSGQIDEALQIMSSHEQAAFPPHWEPPPRHAYRLLQPRIVDVLDAIARLGAAPWVTDIYHRKLGLEYASILELETVRFYPYTSELTVDEAERLMPVFEQSAVARDAATEYFDPAFPLELKREDFNCASNSDEADRRFVIYQRLAAAVRKDDPSGA